MYDLDLLAVGSFDGVLRWIVKQGSAWYYGDLVGGAFADAVLSGWDLFAAPPAEWA